MKTEKLKERSIKIKLEVFNYLITVVLTNNVVKSGEKRGMPGIKHFAAFHAGAVEVPCSIIVLPFGVTPDIVAHECIHCVWHIMKMIGAELEDEVMAYMLSFLMQKTLAFVGKQHKRKRRKVTPKEKEKK